MSDKTLIDYTDEAVLARQNIAPNAACDIDGEFYDIRNLVFLARTQADLLAEAERKLARLRAACGPIHEAADECDEWNHDDDNQAPVDAGTCRAIRAELTGGKDE